MGRLKLFGLALVAAVTSAAALSASAFALELPENLPALAAGETRSWEGKNVGVTTLHAEGLKPVVCTAAAALEGTSTETSSKPPEGRFHIHFSGCTTEVGTEVVKCTGLGETAGVILVLGTWALVFDKLIGKAFESLTTAVLFKNELVHFTCGGIALVNVLAFVAGVSGETLCLHLNPTVKEFTHEFHCIGELAGGTKPKAIEEYGTDKALTENKGKVPVLLASLNEAAAVPALQLGLATMKYLVEIFADQ
jgi:hypothetical protein